MTDITGGDGRKIQHFDYWGEVPPGQYMTKTQLQELDLPRRPGGPVRATVDGYDGAGRRATIDLYAIGESVPTKASAAQLAAASARRTTGTRRCEQCGARPELPCTRRGDWLLCRACAHIARLRDAQKKAADDRGPATERAVDLLADDRLAIVHIDLVDRGTTPAGTQRAPAAAHVTALDSVGCPLVDVVMRLVGPRSRGIPDGAIAPDDAVGAIRQALADRVLLLWDTEALGKIGDALRRLDLPFPFPSGYGRRHDLQILCWQWRGDLDPKTGRQRCLVPPGRADRMLYLLQQIAVPDAHYLGEQPLERQ